MLFVFLSIACEPDMILVSMYLFMLNKLCLSLSLIQHWDEFAGVIVNSKSFDNIECGNVTEYYLEICYLTQ